MQKNRELLKKFQSYLAEKIKDGILDATIGELTRTLPSLIGVFSSVLASGILPLFDETANERLRDWRALNGVLGAESSDSTQDSTTFKEVTEHFERIKKFPGRLYQANGDHDVESMDNVTSLALRLSIDRGEEEIFKEDGRQYSRLTTRTDKLKIRLSDDYTIEEYEVGGIPYSQLAPTEIANTATIEVERTTAYFTFLAWKIPFGNVTTLKKAAENTLYNEVSTLPEFLVLLSRLSPKTRESIE